MSPLGLMKSLCTCTISRLHMCHCQALVKSNSGETGDRLCGARVGPGAAFKGVSWIGHEVHCSAIIAHSDLCLWFPDGSTICQFFVHNSLETILERETQRESLSELKFLSPSSRFKLAGSFVIWRNDRCSRFQILLPQPKLFSAVTLNRTWEALE